MRSALVTGGAGFIGSQLAGRLRDDGWAVTVVDNLSSGRKENVPDDVELLELDLSDERALERLPKGGVDVIFHLASHVGGELSFERPLLDFRSNALATALVINWALDTDVPKLVSTSSMSVYGDTGEEPVGEDAPLAPKTPYAAAKAAGEHLAAVFGDRVGTTVLRLFNVYGPGQDLTNMKQGMVSIFLAMVLAGEPVEVRGPGNRFRDIVYIDDVVDAFVRSADERADKKVYNVGTGRRTRVDELVTEIVRAMGEDPETYPVSFGQGTPGDQFGVFADVSRIRADLGWEPQTTLPDGLAAMADWARARARR